MLKKEYQWKIEKNNTMRTGIQNGVSKTFDKWICMFNKTILKTFYSENGNFPIFKKQNHNKKYFMYINIQQYNNFNWKK